MIKDLINKHVGKAFDMQLSDAVKPFTGSREGQDSIYDPSSGTYVKGAMVEYSGRGVFGSYKSTETNDTKIDINDTKLLCVQSEVTGTPQVDDEIVQGANKYRVIDVVNDPTGSIWVMQLRGLGNVG